MFTIGTNEFYFRFFEDESDSNTVKACKTVEEWLVLIKLFMFMFDSWGSYIVCMHAK